MEAILLIVYVDDIILTNNDLKEMERLKGTMAREFDIKDLRPLRYLLGMKVTMSKEGIMVSQRKYAQLQTCWYTNGSKQEK